MENSSEAMNIFFKIFEVVDEWNEDKREQEEESRKKVVIEKVVWTDAEFTPKTTRVRKVPDAPKRPRCYKVYSDLEVIPLAFPCCKVYVIQL